MMFSFLKRKGVLFFISMSLMLSASIVAHAASTKSPYPIYDNRFVIYNQSEYTLCLENKTFADDYSKVINRLTEKIKLPIYNVLIPSSVEWVKEEWIQSHTCSQAKMIENLIPKLKDNAYVPPVYETLQDHVGDYLYYRTDHHWTRDGAYLGYTALMEEMNMDAVSLSNFKTLTIPTFLGSAYHHTKDEILRKNPDVLTFDIPKLSWVYTIGKEKKKAVLFDTKKAKSQPYGVYLGGDLAYANIQIKHKVSKNERWLVLKDSNGSPFVPYLMNHTDQLIVIDPRHYKTKDLLDVIQSNHITRIVFAFALPTAAGMAKLSDALF